MTTKVCNCVLEGFLASPIEVEAAVAVEISEATFRECKTDGNGGAVLVQNECKTVFVSKTCSEGCTASRSGQFMYANIIRDSYDVSLTLSIVTKSQSSGNLGIDIFSKKCEVENTNFSFLKSPSCPSYIIDQTKEGCLISYSEVFNTTSSYYILSVQEVESTSGKNILNSVNILNNFGVDIILIYANDKTTIQNCNVHNNNGTGYLFKISSKCIIEGCSIQEKYGGSTSKICNIPKDIQPLPSIHFDIGAPIMNECGFIGNINKWSKNNNEGKNFAVLIIFSMNVNTISPFTRLNNYHSLSRY